MQSRGIDVQILLDLWPLLSNSTLYPTPKSVYPWMILQTPQAVTHPIYGHIMEGLLPTVPCPPSPPGYAIFRMKRWILITKKNLTSIKIKTKMSTFVLITHVVFLHLSSGWSTGRKYFNLYWLRVKMPHHRLNNLSELINEGLDAKIGRRILSKDLMDR